MQTFNLDLEYKIIHQAINVKGELHRYNNDTFPHCFKACEIVSLFVHCKFIQNAKNFMEHIIYDVTLDELICLQCLIQMNC